MLSCLRRALDLLRAHGGPDLTLDAVPRDDGPTYDMLGRGDSLGVFQVEPGADEHAAAVAAAGVLRPRH
jgi:error-prone DNA polymerase